MIYSLPMLIFMVGTSHFPFEIFVATGSSRAVFWVIWSVIWGVLELNALGLLGGTSPRGLVFIMYSNRNAIYTSFVYSLVTLVLFALVLQD